MKRMLKGFFNWMVNVVTEFNDSPKDFIRTALITLVIVTVWGLVMGIMGEYR